VYKKENNFPEEKESIQIKSNTKGILKKEIHVKFLNKVRILAWKLNFICYRASLIMNDPLLCTILRI